MSDRPSGTICTLDEQAISANSTSLHCFDRGEGFGLLIVTEASLVSLIFLCYVFALILWNIARLYLDPEKRKRGLKLFHQPMDLLMLSLFFADTLQALGGALNAKWVTDGVIESGAFCNAQGIVQNVGEAAVAMLNLTISFYTFLGLWLRKDILSMKITLGVIASIWVFIAIIVAVGNATQRNPAFESPTPYWCWINTHYMVWRIVAEYMWIWIALLFSLLVYIPLLWLLDVSRAQWRQALVFLAYPLTYCVCVLPLSVTRWIGFVQEANNGKASTPSSALFAGITLFSLSGFFNVVLLLKTKRNVGLFGNLVLVSPRRPPDPESRTDESTVKAERTAELSSEGFGMLPQ